MLYHNVQSFPSWNIEKFEIHFVLWSWLIAIILYIFNPDSQSSECKSIYASNERYKWANSITLCEIRFSHFIVPFAELSAFAVFFARFSGVCVCIMCVYLLSWFGRFCWIQFNIFTTFKQMFTSLVFISFAVALTFFFVQSYLRCYFVFYLFAFFLHFIFYFGSSDGGDKYVYSDAKDPINHLCDYLMVSVDLKRCHLTAYCQCFEYTPCHW